MVLVPEANGVMIVSREDPSMTPAGRPSSTSRERRRWHAVAGHDGHGQVLPLPQEVHLRGRWHEASRLDEQQPEGEHVAMQEVCEREGVPDLLDKIADEPVATSVEEWFPSCREGAPGSYHGSAVRVRLH